MLHDPGHCRGSTEGIGFGDLGTLYAGLRITGKQSGRAAFSGRIGRRCRKVSIKLHGSLVAFKFCKESDRCGHQVSPITR